MKESWNELSQDEQRPLLKRMTPEQLAQQFDISVENFAKLKAFITNIPQETVAPVRKSHNPPKALILNARRDLSFFEANSELIDNSIDEWRKKGAKQPLIIKMNYDLDVLTGEFEDNAGGMNEEDVYKVFIPGESTNTDLSKTVIGSFGMGAKKAIFRLSDGAKVVSCTSDAFSVTSAVPEKWEQESDWSTADGRCESIGIGKTRFYFLKLVMPPTVEDIAELTKRIGRIYAPLIRGDLGEAPIEIQVNGVHVKASPRIGFSGAKGATPRTYEFSHVFPNLSNSGESVPVKVKLTVGLLPALPGSAANREEDWGIDAYGNGRLIQAYLKKEIGFGKPGLGANTQSSKFIRGELFITGHSLGIPWDTHKREYLADHEVSRWIEKQIFQRLKDYARIADNFAWSDSSVRQTEQAQVFSGQIPVVDADAELKSDDRPTWAFAPPEKRKARKAASKGSSTSPTANAEPTSPVSVPPTESTDASTETEDQATDVELTLIMGESEKLRLMDRFGAANDDELAAVISDCLNSGVAYRLTPDQLKAALALFELQDHVELSEALASEMISSLSQGQS